MPPLILTEFQTTPSVPLSMQQRDGLRRLVPGLRLEPTAGQDGKYDITPGQHIGVVSLGELVVLIRPKIPMSSVLFLVSHACGAATWFDDHPEFAGARDPDIADVLAVVLSRMVMDATRRGLLSGYRAEEEALQAPRGRILFDD